jgi:hypothetical protein
MGVVHVTAQPSQYSQPNAKPKAGLMNLVAYV